MYETYRNEQEISLWCKFCLGPEKEDGTTSGSNTNIGNKRKLPNADDKQGSKRQAIHDEVEDMLLLKRSMVLHTMRHSFDSGQTCYR